MLPAFFAALPRASRQANVLRPPGAPVLDPRITLLNRSLELQVAGAEGDAFLVHMPGGFVDATGVARTKGGRKPSEYHGCWDNAPDIEPRVSFKAVRHAALPSTPRAPAGSS